MVLPVSRTVLFIVMWRILNNQKQSEKRNNEQKIDAAERYKRALNKMWKEKIKQFPFLETEISS